MVPELREKMIQISNQNIFQLSSHKFEWQRVRKEALEKKAEYFMQDDLKLAQNTFKSDSLPKQTPGFEPINSTQITK